MSWTTNLHVIKKLIPRKLSWKLTLIYAVLFSAVLIALNAGTLFGVRYYMVEQAKAQVRSSLANTLNRIPSSTETNNLSNSEYLSESDTVPEISIELTDASGKQIISSSKTLGGLPDSSSNIDAITVVELHDLHLITENSRIMENGKLIGYLQVSYDMHSEYRFIKLLFIFMAFADFLGIAFSILTGFLLSRRALKPIDSLTRTAKLISSSDLSQRVDVSPADDELSRLAITFNEMIERLQLSFEKQNRFVSDASHELRTPIAIIKGYADLIEQWAKDDPQVLEESVTAIRKEAKSMTVLTEELLFLARGDSGKLKFQKEDVQAANLLNEIIDESGLIDPSHHFEWTAPDNL
jgi:two-component system sensor histidine kinase ArlS